MSSSNFSCFVVLILHFLSRLCLERAKCRANYVFPEFQDGSLLLVLRVQVANCQVMATFFREQKQRGYCDCKANSTPGLFSVLKRIDVGIRDGQRPLAAFENSGIAP